jgi:hypothetical protein
MPKQLSNYKICPFHITMHSLPLEFTNHRQQGGFNGLMALSTAASNSINFNPYEFPD